MDGTGLTQSNPTHVLIFLVDWVLVVWVAQAMHSNFYVTGNFNYMLGPPHDAS